MGRWYKVNYAGVKTGEIDLFRIHLDSRVEFANSGFRAGMWAKAHRTLEGERDGPGGQSQACLPFAGTHSYLHIFSKSPA